MRTLMVICGGVVRHFRRRCSIRCKPWRGSALRRPNEKIALVGAWFAIAAANLLVGVLHDSYSLHQELPIFLLIFLSPADLALVVNWRFQ
jgi:hypothetical protein